MAFLLLLYILGVLVCMACLVELHYKIKDSNKDSNERIEELRREHHGWRSNLNNYIANFSVDLNNHGLEIETEIERLKMKIEVMEKILCTPSKEDSDG